MATLLQGRLIDVETRESFHFQYNPSEISDTHPPRWVDLEIPGMSHPRQQFVSGGARTIAFTLHLVRTTQDVAEVATQVSWLRSLTYPEYEQGKVKRGPHRVLLDMGGLYLGVECVVRTVNVRYMGFFEADTLYPR